MKKLLYITLVFTFFTQCKKKEIGPQCPSCKEEILVENHDVLILCEGNFGWGNASLSRYNPADKSVQLNVYQNVNLLSLGDVAQTMKEINSDLYLVVNNSGKVVIMDTATYQHKGSINGLISPRYIEAVGNNKAYISDLYANQISVVDLSTNQISGTIPLGRWSENLLHYNGKVFASMPDTNWVLVIDAVNDVVSDTLIVSHGAGNMVLDKNNQLWVLCSGGLQQSFPALYQINPLDNSISKSFSFPTINESPGNLCINNTGDKLFFVNQHVFQMGINDVVLPTNPVILANGSIFYGLGIDPNTNEIYLADAIDYVQQGKIYRYDSIFASLDTFSVGVIPQAFWFK